MTDPVEIHVLDKQVRLLQPEKGFRTSLDTVLLAAACPAKGGQRVLDMGCGVGGVLYCLAHRVFGLVLTGVEMQTDYIALARENSVLNDVDPVPSFILSDIRDFAVAEPAQRFDHVLCNPPFLEAGHHVPAQDEGRAKALGHKDTDMDVAGWVDAGFRNLKSGGTLTMIHRADAVDRIIRALGQRFGAVEIIPVYSRAGDSAKRVIVRAVKDRKSPATLYGGIVLHEADGSYTPAADKILRGGGPVL